MAEAQNTQPSVLSDGFISHFKHRNRRSFDSGWRKSAPNSAQDDIGFLMKSA